MKINKLEKMHYYHYKRLCFIIGKFDMKKTNKKYSNNYYINIYIKMSET